MKMPTAILESVATLLAPYEIDFKKMCQQYQAANNTPEKEWMTLQEAADFSKVSVWTVRRWCRKGVASKKTSRARCGRILIKSGSLKEFIENLPG